MHKRIMCTIGALVELASHKDVLRGSSRVPVPQTSAELKDKFLSQVKSADAREAGMHDEPLRTSA